MRTRKSSSWSSAHAPMTQLSLTPLIGVLQAVLVMVLVTLPLQSHVIHEYSGDGGCDGGFASESGPPALRHLSLKDTGEMYLDGIPVNRRELRVQLQVAAARSPRPQVIVAGESNAQYGDFAEAIAIVKAAGLGNAFPDLAR